MTLREKMALEVRTGELYNPTLKETMRFEWDTDKVPAACTHDCHVEPDGTCPHNRPSWWLLWGII